MIDIILVEPAYSGNIGSVCRVMANFGFSRLILVNPQCEVISADTFRMAKHADDIVNNAKIRRHIPKYDILIGTTAKVFDDYNIRRSPITPKELVVKLNGLNDIDGKKKLGILFGRESSGLTNNEIDKCDILVTIPSSGRYAAMNLSHAVTVLLYELFSVNNNTVRQKIPLANEGEIRQLNKMTRKIIDTLGFQAASKRKVQKQIWNSIYNKSLITKREAHGAMGLLNRILRQINAKKKK